MNRDRLSLARRWPTMSGMGANTTADFNTFRRAAGRLVDVRSPRGSRGIGQGPSTSRCSVTSNGRRWGPPTSSKDEIKPELGLSSSAQHWRTGTGLKEAAADDPALRIAAGVEECAPTAWPGWPPKCTTPLCLKVVTRTTAVGCWSNVPAPAGEAARRPDWQRKLISYWRWPIATSLILKAWHTTAAAALAASVSPINPVRSTTKTAWSRP